MNTQKFKFVIETFPSLLKEIPVDTIPAFGKMNLIQMIEHMSESVRIANGRFSHDEIITPEERIPAMQDFVRSDREFKPNTKNALLGEEPVPVKSSSKEEAIAELEAELQNFISHFKDQENKTQRNPFFGDLDFSLWTDLLYKHSVHHLKQFNVQIPPLN